MKLILTPLNHNYPIPTPYHWHWLNKLMSSKEDIITTFNREGCSPMSSRTSVSFPLPSREQKCSKISFAWFLTLSGCFDTKELNIFLPLKQSFFLILLFTSLYFSFCIISHHTTKIFQMFINEWLNPFWVWVLIDFGKGLGVWTSLRPVWSNNSNEVVIINRCTKICVIINKHV